MTACDLTKKKCVPCEGGIPPLSESDARKLLSNVTGWALKGKTIEKEYSFDDFAEAIAFVNQVARIAEAEGHHPDIFIHKYRYVRVSIWTHAVNGLTENDFILAAKIDEI